MPGKKKEKKAKSKSQQRLFGMVTAYNNGKLKLEDLPDSLATKIKGIADGSRRKTGDKRKNTKGVTKKAAKELASTKHKGKPERVTETLRFEDFVNEEIEVKSMEDFADGVAELEVDALKGGEAEGKTIEDVADKHDIPVEYLEKIMIDAIEIEMEHTDDPEVAARIALDHLWETPLYYDDVLGLPNMEEELEDLEDDEIQDTIQKVLKYGEGEQEDADDYEQEHKKRENDVSIDVQESIVIRLTDYLTEDLTKFVGIPGDTEIWYEKETCFDGWDFREKMYKEEPDHDMEYTKRCGERIDPKNLEKTHTLLGTIGETDLNEIYHLMNNWGVGDLSNRFLDSKGITHTSMSIGDIIKIDDTVYFVDSRGFKDITNE